jgi:hypothetical protein
MNESESLFPLTRVTPIRNERMKGKFLSVAMADLLCVMIAGLAHLAGNSAIAANNDCRQKPILQ